MPKESIIVLDRENQQIVLLEETPLGQQAWSQPRAGNSPGLTSVTLGVEGQPSAVLPMRLSGDALSDLIIMRSGRTAPTVVFTLPLSTFVVTNTNDDGSGSLRAAMQSANQSPGLDVITFRIGQGPQTIRPQQALPIITDPVIIDGTTQPGYAGRPIIEITGRDTAPQDGFVITAGNSVVRGLVMNGFSSPPGLIIGFAIRLTDGGGNIVEGNYLGTNLSGDAAVPNAFDGIIIAGSRDNLVGGTVEAARNVISGNIHKGVLIINGLLPNPDFQHMRAFSGATNNKVLGNFIGTDYTGTSDGGFDINASAALGNGDDGIGIFGSDNNYIGLPDAGGANLISNNGGGVVATAAWRLPIRGPMGRPAI
ncbi:MAG TPA: hypothetical protein VJ464_25805 [Blastocatellia bacterium]|nr:hypothetical protein [Blastocatellia bacterium]